MQHEDSGPELEVNVVGTANPNGEFMQHEAVLPQKPRAEAQDDSTVVIRPEPPARARDASQASDADGLMDAGSGDEITSVTKGHRSAGGGLYHLLTVLESHRLAMLSLALGSVLLILAGLLAFR